MICRHVSNMLKFHLVLSCKNVFISSTFADDAFLFIEKIHSDIPELSNVFCNMQNLVCEILERAHHAFMCYSFRTWSSK